MAIERSRFKRNKQVKKGRDQFSRLRRNYPMLRAIVNSSPEDRKTIIRKASADLMRTIADICYNILEGNIELSNEHRNKLGKNKKYIRRMADKSSGLYDKKIAMIQKGGFIPGLVPALSIVASIIGGLLSK